MEELNKCQDLLVAEDDGCDTLVVNDLGEMLSFTQVSEDNRVHNVIVSIAQAKSILAKVTEFSGR